MGGVNNNVIWEQVYNPSTDSFHYVVYDQEEHTVGHLHSLETTTEKTHIPWKGAADFIKAELLYLPTDVLEYESDQELWSETQQFIHDYCDIKWEDEIINTQYVALTWMYDKLNELPYRRFLGDFGTGKSRALTTLGVLCYRPIIIKAVVTPPSIYRTIEKIRGTMLLDEAHFQKNSEIWSHIMGILNAGYERSGAVIRCLPNTHEPAPFQSFSPKVLASRIPFPDQALESRCLTCITYQTHRDDIPVNLDEAFYHRSQLLRNQWLLWRFRNHSRIFLPDPEILNLRTTTPRLRQIIAPLSGLRSQAFFKDYLLAQHEHVLELRRESWEGKVIQAIIDLYMAAGQPESPVFQVSEIADRYRKTDGIEPKTFTSRRCGSILQRLQFETFRQARGRFLVWNLALLQRQAMDYGLTFDDVAQPELKPEPQVKLFPEKREPTKLGQEERIHAVLKAIHEISDKDNRFWFHLLVDYCDTELGLIHVDVNEIVGHLRDQGKLTKVQDDGMTVQYEFIGTGGTE